MKALKYILFLLLIVIIGVSIYVAVQPNSFEVKRTKTIQAPAAVVYNHVIDFKTWEAWSSWAESDPDMTITLSEQTSGINGSYSWEDKDGVGTMKTVDAKPNTSIQQEMQFADFPKSDVSWELITNDTGTTDVTWTIAGKDLPFGFKAFAFISGGLEKQIGPHYERSLIKLDSIIVSEMKSFKVVVDGITTHSGGFYLYNTTSCKMDDFESKMKEMLPKVGDYAKNNNISTAGMPFISYHKWDIPNNSVMFSCCVPITSQIVTTDSDILTGQLQPFRAVKTTFKGNYENLKAAWDATMAYIPENNLEFTEAGPMLEVYLTDPMHTPNPKDWVTEIYIAIKE